MKTETVKTIHEAVSYFGLSVSLFFMLAAGCMMIYAACYYSINRLVMVNQFVHFLRKRKQFKEYAETHDAMRDAMLETLEQLQDMGWDLERLHPNPEQAHQHEIYSALVAAIPHHSMKARES